MAPRTKTRPAPTSPLSIVGEAQAQLADDLAVKWQSDEEVAAWVASAPDEWLTCKERVRHRFTSLAERKRKGKIVFIGVEEFPGNPLLIHAPLVCLDCGQAYSDERFAWVGRGKNAHAIRVSRTTRPYQAAKKGPDGITYYAKPGTGRKAVRTIVDAIADAGMADMGTQAQVLAAARAKQAEIKEAQRVADERAALKAAGRQTKFSAAS